MISKMILKSLRTNYESEIDCARTNIEVYLNYPAGVAEHPDIVASVNGQLEIMAESRDKLQELDLMEELMEDKDLPETAAEIING